MFRSIALGTASASTSDRLARRAVTLLAFTVALGGCGDDDGTGPKDQPEVPSPRITALTPDTVKAGGEGFTLAIDGTGFFNESVLYWNDVKRPSTFISESRLTTQISAAEIAKPGGASVTVHNFGPRTANGSNPAYFIVVPPEPVVSDLVPDGRYAGYGGFKLSVGGAGFDSSSVVQWNGSDRPTTFINHGLLNAQISAEDVVAAGNYRVTVRPGDADAAKTPGIDFRVTNARPDVTSLSPGYAPFGADGATITVHGKGFVAVSVGRWNGMDRATTFVSASELKVALTAEDLITMGEGRVSVFNPEPGGGEWVDGLPLTVGIKSLASLDLKATDLVYDSIGKKIYAAIDPADSKLANHVVRIDPMTGEIEDRVAFQTAPRRLAVSDDGRYLYVVANSASTVHRLALGTLSADLEFEVDPAEATIYASDLEVLPGRPGSVAIARLNSCCSPGFEGVAIYDDGVMRPTLAMKPGEASATVIEFAESDTLLYGFNNHTNEFGFRRLIVADTGVTEASVQKNLVYRLGADIRYAGGRIYTTDGGIVDPVAGTRVGDLNFGYHGPSIPDPANGRVLFLYSARLRAYSTTTLDIIDMHRVPGDDGRFADNLIRWGEDGLAYRTADRIFILRTNLVK